MDPNLSRILKITIAAAVMLASAAAHGEPPETATIMAALKEQEAGQGIASRDYALGRSFSINGEARHVFSVEKGKTYLVLGACGDACGDVEVVVEDAVGHVLGNDDAEAPFVVFAPEMTGRVSIIVTMDDCGEEACSYGLGFYALAARKPAAE